MPVGASGSVGGVLKGAAALYDNGVPAAPAAPEYDIMGNPTGTQSAPAPAIPAKPLQERTLYKAGQKVQDIAPTMSDAEKESLVAASGTSDAQEGIAAFVAKRRPQFRGE